MPSIFDKRNSDDALLLKVMGGSLSIRNHLELLQWMQADFQQIIRHDALLSFSYLTPGDVRDHDIVSSLPGLRTTQHPPQSIKGLCACLHRYWQESADRSCSASTLSSLLGKEELAAIPQPLGNLQHVIVHAIPDTRLKGDHVYALLRAGGVFDDNDRENFELLLPHIDAAARKVDRLPKVEQPLTVGTEGLRALVDAGMSPREIEILAWVRNGKTNEEIGRILRISSNTVKNHLQRVFRKINVSNRAQAVWMLRHSGTTASPDELA